MYFHLTYGIILLFLVWNKDLIINVAVITAYNLKDLLINLWHRNGLITVSHAINQYRRYIITTWWLIYHELKKHPKWEGGRERTYIKCKHWRTTTAIDVYHRYTFFKVKSCTWSNWMSRLFNLSCVLIRVRESTQIWPWNKNVKVLGKYSTEILQR